MSLRTFYFAHSQMYVIPIEHQRDGGISREFAELLKQERNPGDEFIGLLNEALVKYHERIGALFRRDRPILCVPR
jgi:hypothetical protein